LKKKKGKKKKKGRERLNRPEKVIRQHEKKGENGRQVKRTGTEPGKAKGDDDPGGFFCHWGLKMAGERKKRKKWGRKGHTYQRKENAGGGKEGKRS